MATSAMLKAGANEGASGENAICQTIKTVNIILGPISIIYSNSLLGEISQKIATAITEAEAEKFYFLLAGLTLP